MNFKIKKTLLYSDTQLSDIFISDYLPALDADSVKLYVYCLFLAKYNKTFDVTTLSEKLGMSKDIVRNCTDNLRSCGLIVQNENSITFNDLKERAVLSNFKPRESSDPQKCMSSIIHKKRNRVIKSINNKFFQGLMSPSWYTDIDSWFDMFKFEDDAMYMLFQHCFDRGVLQKNYILTVARDWFNKGITTSLDVENYYEEYQKIKNISYKIRKKLNRSTPFSEYDEKVIEKWISSFKYDFDIIELALQKTTGTANPNLNYVNRIIENWYKMGLKTREDIISYSNSNKGKKNKSNTNTNNIDTKVLSKNFEQRDYDAKYLESFYTNFDSDTSAKQGGNGN